MSCCTNPECVGEAEILAAELEGFDEGYDAGYTAAMEEVEDGEEPTYDEGFDDGYADASADIHSALEVYFDGNTSFKSKEVLDIIEGYCQ